MYNNDDRDNDNKILSCVTCNKHLTGQSLLQLIC